MLLLRALPTLSAAAAALLLPSSTFASASTASDTILAGAGAPSASGIVELGNDSHPRVHPRVLRKDEAGNADPGGNAGGGKGGPGRGGGKGQLDEAALDLDAPESFEVDFEVSCAMRIYHSYL